MYAAAWAYTVDDRAGAAHHRGDAGPRSGARTGDGRTRRARPRPVRAPTRTAATRPGPLDDRRRRRAARSAARRGPDRGHRGGAPMSRPTTPSTCPVARRPAAGRPVDGERPRGAGGARRARRHRQPPGAGRRSPPSTGAPSSPPTCAGAGAAAAWRARPAWTGTPTTCWPSLDHLGLDRPRWWPVTRWAGSWRPPSSSGTPTGSPARCSSTAACRCRPRRTAPPPSRP